MAGAIPGSHPASLRAARNGLWNVARIVLVLPVFLYFTHYLYVTLGDDTRGAWTLVGAFWLQPALLDLGFGEALTRAVARRRHQGRGPILQAALAGLVLLALVLVVLLVAYLGPGREPLIGLLGNEHVARDQLAGSLDRCVIALAASMLGWGALKVIEGLERYGVASLIRVLTALSFAGTGIIFLHQEPELISLGDAAVLAASLGLLGGFLALGIVIRAPLPADPSTPPAPPPLREILTYGPILYLNALSGLVETVVDRYLVGVLAPGGAAAAGYFDNAQDTGNRFRTLPLLLAAPLYPAAAAARTREEVQRLFHGAFRVNVLVATPLLIGAASFAWPFALLWLGQDSDTETSLRVHETALALCILAVGMYAQVLYVPCFHILNGRGHPWPGTLASLLSGALNLALALALVQGTGTRGVALAAGTGHLAACLLMLWWFHRREGLSLRRTLVDQVQPPLAAMIASSGVALLLLRHLEPGWLVFLGLAAASVVLYVLLLWVMGHLQLAELRLALRIVLGRPAPEEGTDPGPAPTGGADTEPEPGPGSGPEG